uniref:Secreted protein n=1 Tax=Knipowitschia caucasica TaxID=637954 RepID=A0AAV2IXN2_KNICA
MLSSPFPRLAAGGLALASSSCDFSPKSFSAVPNAQWPQPRSSVAQRGNVYNNLQPSISGASFHGEHEYGVMSIKNNHTRRNFVLLVTLGASNSENSTEPVDLRDTSPVKLKPANATTQLQLTGRHFESITSHKSKATKAVIK